MTNFGAFVELDEGIEGLIHVSEFDDSQQRQGEKIELKVGETYPMKIIKLSPAERKIGLSIRALKSRRVPRRLGGVSGETRATGARRWAITSRNQAEADRASGASRDRAASRRRSSLNLIPN